MKLKLLLFAWAAGLLLMGSSADAARWRRYYSRAYSPYRSGYGYRPDPYGYGSSPYVYKYNTHRVPGYSGFGYPGYSTYGYRYGYPYYGFGYYSNSTVTAPGYGGYYLR